MLVSPDNRTAPVMKVSPCFHLIDLKGPPSHVAANCRDCPAVMTELAGVSVQLIVAANAEPPMAAMDIATESVVFFSFIAFPFKTRVTFNRGHNLPL